MIRAEGLHKSFGDVHAVAGVELDGLRLPESLDAVRSRLGVVPDQARLYGRNTATEYLDRFGYLYGVPEKIRRERIAALLERFELADRSDTILAAYSRGMAQKVALILTTHVLGEAELMADRVAIMRRGVIVASGTLDDLRHEAEVGRRFNAHLARSPEDPASVTEWLSSRAVAHNLHGAELSYTLPWQAGVADRAEFAAQLQALLAGQGAPFHELEERQATLESVYLKAMEVEVEPPHPAPRADIAGERGGGIRAPRMFASLPEQGDMLRQSLPFYVSSWWRRGDLSWVTYLNAFVLLLVAGTSLFGQLPG